MDHQSIHVADVFFISIQTKTIDKRENNFQNNPCNY